MVFELAEGQTLRTLKLQTLRLAVSGASAKPLPTAHPLPGTRDFATSRALSTLSAHILLAQLNAPAFWRLCNGWFLRCFRLSVLDELGRVAQPQQGCHTSRRGRLPGQFLERRAAARSGDVAGPGAGFGLRVPASDLQEAAQMSVMVFQPRHGDPAKAQTSLLVAAREGDVARARHLPSVRVRVPLCAPVVAAEGQLLDWRSDPSKRDLHRQRRPGLSTCQTQAARRRSPLHLAAGQGQARQRRQRLSDCAGSFLSSLRGDAGEALARLRRRSRLSGCTAQDAASSCYAGRPPREGMIICSLVNPVVS